MTVCFTFSFLGSDLDLRPLDLKFALLVTLVQLYVSTKGKGQALDIAPQVDTATAEALEYMAHTKQRRTYLPCTFPATLEVSMAFLFQENRRHGTLLPALGIAYRRLSRQHRHCRLSSDI